MTAQTLKHLLHGCTERSGVGVYVADFGIPKFLNYKGEEVREVIAVTPGSEVYFI